MVISASVGRAACVRSGGSGPSDFRPFPGRLWLQKGQAGPADATPMTICLALSSPRHPQGPNVLESPRLSRLHRGHLKGARSRIAGVIG